MWRDWDDPQYDQKENAAGRDLGSARKGLGKVEMFEV